LQSCDLLGDRRLFSERGARVGLGTIEGLVMLELAQDGVEEFSHGGDEGLEFGFAAPDEVLTATRAGIHSARRRCLLPALEMCGYFSTEDPEV
jgi:hypothetical protein